MIRDWFNKLLEGRYVGMLEGEVMRLRAENRALTNSLLGTAGFPPVDYAEPPKLQQLSRPRKRSWHQIQAWRERAAAAERTAHRRDDGELDSAQRLDGLDERRHAGIDPGRVAKKGKHELLLAPDPAFDVAAHDLARGEDLG